MQSIPVQFEFPAPASSCHFRPFFSHIDAQSVIVCSDATPSRVLGAVAHHALAWILLESLSSSGSNDQRIPPLEPSVVQGLQGHPWGHWWCPRFAALGAAQKAGLPASSRANHLAQQELGCFVTMDDHCPGKDQ